MTKTTESNILKQVEDLVGTNSTISNLKGCLAEIGVDSLPKEEWEQLCDGLKRNYDISDETYPYDVEESYNDMIN